ncbi:MAG: P-loop NTPase, partial [Clostridia bacterium]|nr:P-loop NTPase [Clostridia bacterium]
VTGAVAGALAERGFNVLLIDGDLGLGNLDLTLGLQGETVGDLCGVLEGRDRLAGALRRISKDQPLWYAPLCLGPPPTTLPDGLERLFSLLTDRFDWLLIDCPSGIGETVLRLARGASPALLVTTPDASALRDASRTCRLLTETGLAPRLVINRLRPELIRSGDAPDIDTMIDRVGAQLIGVVPEDPLVTPLQNAGTPLLFHGASEAARPLRDIARRLLGENCPLRL